MKKSIIFFMSLFVMGHTVFSLTVNTTAGNLTNALTATEKSTVTNLIITGTIDARDFVTMRDKMPLLAVLDLSGVNIASYTGSSGTGTSTQTYQADIVPNYAFINKWSGLGTSKISLTSVTLPNSSTGIMTEAFNGCTGLVTLNSGPLVTYIYTGAFYGCTSLKTVNIQSANTIYNSAFYGCTALKTINLPSNVTSIGSDAFHGCVGLTSFNIPSSTNSIGGSAFKDCTGLKSITIPFALTWLGNQAFYGCSGLASINAYPTTPIIQATQVFDVVNKTTCILHVPIGYKAIYQVAPMWLDFVNIVEDLASEVDNVAECQVKIYSNQNSIIVNGTSVGELVTVYNLNGINLYTIPSKEERIFFPINCNDIYIVKIKTENGTAIRKIIKN